MCALFSPLMGRFFDHSFSSMVYEHLLRCFIPEDPSSRLSDLFHVTIIVTCGGIPRSVALMLRVNILLTMAKDINGLRPIVVSEVFIWLISHSIVLQHGGPFQKHLSPHRFGVSTPKAMKPSLSTSKPFLIYILIGLWYKLTSKTFLLMFFKLLFLNNYVMSKGLW